MSVLSLPRIHFTGFTDWSPSTANNSSTVYDEDKVEPVLNAGVTYDTYLKWLKEVNVNMAQPNGSWNVYGDHGTRFAESKVMGAELTSGTRPTSDAVFGTNVALQGLNYSDGFAPARLV